MKENNKIGERRTERCEEEIGNGREGKEGDKLRGRERNTSKNLMVNGS